MTMSLMKLESQLRETEAEILDCYDFDTGEELIDPRELEDRAAILRQQAVVKRDHYARVLKSGFFKDMEKKIDDKIKRLQNEKKDLQFRKEQIELALHNHVSRNDMKTMPILGDDGKPELYLTTEWSVRKTGVDMARVEPQYVKVKPPTLSLDEYERIISLLRLSSNMADRKVLESLQDNSQRFCNVSDLPDDHAALMKQVRPTVKTTIGKPKDEQGH